MIWRIKSAESINCCSERATKLMYRFREVICPICDRRFVLQLRGAKFRIKDQGGLWYRGKCAGCGAHLLFSEDVKNAVIWEEDIRSEDITIAVLVLSKNRSKENE